MAAERSLRPLRALLLVLPLLALLTPAARAQSDFIRGDANGNGAVDIADAIYGLDHLFGGGPAICRDAVDSNDDGQVNLADPIHSLAYQFSSGPAPTAPFPACGSDPTGDLLDCLGPVPACPPTGDPPTAFRFTSLEIRDPHVFTTFLICVDSTTTVNGLIADAMTADADADGDLDQSFLIVFRPLNPAAPAGPIDFLANAACTAPLAGTSCDVGPSTLTVGLDGTNQAVGNCLGPIPGTTNAWSPAISSPSGPCFRTAATSISLDLAGIIVPLEDARLGGTYVGIPPTSIASGLGYGFISVATANATILPATLPLVGGLPLSALLPGGAGNCSSIDARDTGPDGVTLGWWIYFNYTAVEVPYTGP